MIGVSRRCIDDCLSRNSLGARINAKAITIQKQKMFGDLNVLVTKVEHIART